MFKTRQEFTFSINHSETIYNFTGRLVFKDTSLNSIGSLHTQEELNSFGDLLNENLSIPEYWTLEILSELLFNSARPVFKKLNSLALFLTDEPQRISEYGNKIYNDDDILELEEIK